jgi:hypothetical protein
LKPLGGNESDLVVDGFGDELCACAYVFIWGMRKEIETPIAEIEEAIGDEVI